MGVGARNAAAASNADVLVEVRGRNLKAELERLKEFDPLLARAVRKKLREAGKSVIQYMHIELDKPSQGIVTGSKKSTRLTTTRSSNRREGVTVTRRQFVSSVTTSGSRGRSGRRSSASWHGASAGGREEIKKRLAVAIQTGKRSGIRIRGAGTPFAKAYNSKQFRHPVFGDRSTWVTQAGRPYFGQVITQRREALAQAVIDALDEGLDEFNKQGGA